MFVRRAVFNGATFEGDAEIDLAKFGGYADFEEATFSGHAVFRHAVSGDTGRFSGASFGRTADFIRTPRVPGPRSSSRPGSRTAPPASGRTGPVCVDQHRAGPARPLIAALLRARQLEVVAQSVEQRHPAVQVQPLDAPVDAHRQGTSADRSPGTYFAWGGAILSVSATDSRIAAPASVITASATAVRKPNSCQPNNPWP
jgi:hypothetical protein